MSINIYVISEYTPGDDANDYIVYEKSIMARDMGDLMYQLNSYMEDILECAGETQLDFANLQLSGGEITWVGADEVDPRWRVTRLHA